MYEHGLLETHVFELRRFEGVGDQKFLFSTGQIFCQKTFIPYCSHEWPKTFPHSYALLRCLVFYKNAFL